MWLIQSWWITGFAIVLIVGIVAGLVLRTRRTSPEFTALDARYQEAVDESERWLAKWNELFTLNAGTEDLLDDERLLIVEAQAAATDAAAEASSLRNEYANRYLANGFERLNFITAAQPLKPSLDWETEWRHAIARIEHHLETLWIDQHSAAQARARLRAFQLQACQSSGRRSGLIQLASTVRLFDPPLDCSNGFVTTGATMDLTDEVDYQRHRLRAERALLRDSPLSARDLVAPEQ